MRRNLVVKPEAQHRDAFEKNSAIAALKTKTPAEILAWYSGLTSAQKDAVVARLIMAVLHKKDQ